MLNKINSEKIKEILMINKEQSELIRYILKGQKVKNVVKDALKDSIYNIDDILGLDNLYMNRTLLYNTIPITKKQEICSTCLTEYEDLYIDILRIIKKYINEPEYRFMFKNDSHYESIYFLISNLNDLRARINFDDLKYILKNINVSSGVRINQTKTYLRFLNYVNIKEEEINSEIINYIKDTKDDNKQLVVYKVLKTFYGLEVDKKFKGFVFRILNDIKECNNDKKLNIIDRFLDIIYNNGYLLENNNYNRYFFNDMLDTINKEYNNKNIEFYLDLLNEKDIILNNDFELVDKAFILNSVLNKEINISCKDNMIKYIKLIMTCKDEELKKRLISKIGYIKYNKAYEWLIEFYPIIIRYGNITKKQEIIDELSYMNDDNKNQEKFCKILSIPVEYTINDLI